MSPTLLARFDSRALRAPASPEGLVQALALRHAAQHNPAWAVLQSWCFEGAGDGCSPLWQPSALPRVEQRFKLAQLQGDGDTAAHWAACFARHLDGDERLQAAGSAAARLALRLRVKLKDCQWWRARQPDDPWDCGHIGWDEAACRQLALFLPRRATLLLADRLPATDLLACLAALVPRQAGFAHPVRLLVLGEAPPALLQQHGAALTLIPLAAWPPAWP